MQFIVRVQSPAALAADRPNPGKAAGELKSAGGHLPTLERKNRTMEALEKVFSHQAKHGNLIYTYTIQKTKSFNSKKLHFPDALTAQLNDIAANHSSAEEEAIERAAIYRTAEEQIEEYTTGTRARKPRA